MMLSISAVALLGAAAFFLLKSRAVSVGAAAVLFLFGFFAAGTGAYGPITQLCAALAHSLAGLRP
ncbi:hypothetical protein LO771_10405 [Streptacidiphilus sp. ASG 303]|uniref:hypothetical protein n=1 Tax=Streptacidiphilus sp. ASG 303 TaxID=2896847 RepID=UPI001E643E8D|nr:hypothetical protein [Streptacidiphilus sp. ASG 303]MCD0482798.1 hypothetical protein [Streptacidiphilus sp. ASG 303]